MKRRMFFSVVCAAFAAMKAKVALCVGTAQKPEMFKAYMAVPSRYLDAMTEEEIFETVRNYWRTILPHFGGIEHKPPTIDDLVCDKGGVSVVGMAYRSGKRETACFDIEESQPSTGWIHNAHRAD